MRIPWLSLLLVPMACGGAATDISLTTDDVVVTSVLPAEAQRGIEVTLTILGSGFDAGTSVSFVFNDLPTEAITVDNTTFVSSTELKAKVRIKLSAPLGRYGVRILTGRGSRGRGNEKFKTLVEMETLGPGWAYAMNLYGTIVGYSTPPGGGQQSAFVRLSGSALMTLPVPTGALFSSIAYDITDSDLIVGAAGPGINPPSLRPARWKVDGLRTFEELFPRTSADWVTIRGEAKRANESGLIVGWVNPNEVPGGAQRSFCWRETGWTIVPPPDANYISSGVPWDVNEAGDAVGRIVRQNPGISQAFVLHCHASTPNLTILQNPQAGTFGAVAHAIAEDGTVYGSIGPDAVRWRPSGVDQWGPPEVLAGVPFLPERVTAGGRLVGGKDGIAYLWDQTIGLIPLSAASEGSALAWFARDNGPGTRVDVVGTALGTEYAVYWRGALQVP